MATSLRDKYDRVYAKDRKSWRGWLQKNHERTPGIWLVYYKKGSNKKTVTYEEAVEEALCFGWIDSLAQPIDNESYMQLFTPRKPKSNWVRSNKERVARLIERGLMMPAGLAKVEAAKQDGSWSRHDAAENLEMPPELKKALSARKGALQNFRKFTPSVQKQCLFWLGDAKRDETRMKRIAVIVEAAAAGRKPFS